MYDVGGSVVEQRVKTCLGLPRGRISTAVDGARKAQRVHQSILLRGGIDGVSGCYHDATDRTRRLSTRMVAATRVRERAYVWCA